MYKVSESQINGQGVIATQLIPEDTELGTWCSKFPTSMKDRELYNHGMEHAWYESSILGRFCNHLTSPNTRCELKDGVVYLYSIVDIEDGEEITVDYQWCQDITGFEVPFLN